MVRRARQHDYNVLLQYMEPDDPTTMKIGKFPHIQQCANECARTTRCKFFSFIQPHGAEYETGQSRGDCFQEFADWGATNSATATGQNLYGRPST